MPDDHLHHQPAGDGTKYFAGALDEVALYTTSLSAAVIADRYQLGTAAS